MKKTFVGDIFSIYTARGLILRFVIASEAKQSRIN